MVMWIVDLQVVNAKEAVERHARGAPASFHAAESQGIRGLLADLVAGSRSLAHLL